MRDEEHRADDRRRHVPHGLHRDRERQPLLPADAEQRERGDAEPLVRADEARRRRDRDPEVERRRHEHRVEERQLDADRAADEDRPERPGAPRGDAEAEPHEPPLDGERIGKPFERVAHEPARQPAVLPPPAGAPARVRAGRGEEQARSARDEHRADDDPVDPALVRDERQAHQKERDEREDVEAAVEHDGRERHARRRTRRVTPSARAAIPDTTRKHVVHGHARDDHLDETALREPRVGDPPPPRRL